jgi:hypothetical protein
MHAWRRFAIMQLQAVNCLVFISLRMVVTNTNIRFKQPPKTWHCFRNSKIARLPSPYLVSFARAARERRVSRNKLKSQGSRAVDWYSKRHEYDQKSRHL